MGRAWAEEDATARRETVTDPVFFSLSRLSCPLVPPSLPSFSPLACLSSFPPLHSSRSPLHPSQKEVERRRRETINTGINRLAAIVPTMEKNKAAILERAAQYIEILRRSETANIEKWTMEKTLMDQSLEDMKTELDEERALRKKAEARVRQLLQAGASANGATRAAVVSTLVRNATPNAVGATPIAGKTAAFSAVAAKPAAPYVFATAAPKPPAVGGVGGGGFVGTGLHLPMRRAAFSAATTDASETSKKQRIS